MGRAGPELSSHIDRRNRVIAGDQYSSYDGVHGMTDLQLLSDALLPGAGKLLRSKLENGRRHRRTSPGFEPDKKIQAVRKLEELLILHFQPSDLTLDWAWSDVPKFDSNGQFSPKTAEK